MPHKSGGGGYKSRPGHKRPKPIKKTPKKKGKK